ncbi:peptide ABC transporter permease [Acidihalobacter yilgarnensis]|uniref:Peptide ABC transporter permease n=1 Tax=Acidihalobacter yilgarnensis TaxID=2819280 RepID=A0A1D8IP19_9GAMM|nr:ABC transporter permease [Acidihalobacter yilgarnensis]AOU98145.1 peptide ABC transporter permease [Acidihalobacter yilgarnensis]
MGEDKFYGDGGVPAARPRRMSRGPWATAWRKLRRDRAAMMAIALLAIIVVLCLSAPLYATYVAKSNPFQSNLSGSFILDGKMVAVMQPSTTGLGLGVTPLGPTWQLGPYMLGADDQGRDVAARLLYGGLNSLLIGTMSTLICLFLAALLGTFSGFFGGVVDTVVSRLLDVLWAFPIFFLAISLSIVLINKSISFGPITINSGSLWLPILIVGIVYVPYVARPIRGQVLSLKQSEFVLASIGLGVPAHRILLRDILPNVSTTIIVFVPLMMALCILTESALSFLSIGVQPPAASWGTIIQDGQNLLYTRPLVAVAPGVAIALTVLALNVLGDGVRDALDPRSKVRIRVG